MGDHRPLYFILGAGDGEMFAIASILRYYKQHFGFAINQANRRIRSSEAYYKNLGIYNQGPFINPRVCNVITIECAAPSWLSASLAIDHHHPGDHGYNCDHLNYWKGSSIGQLVKILSEYGVDVNLDQHFDDVNPRIVAASDHCPAHALKGLIPDIDPDELFRYRLGQVMWRLKVDEFEAKRILTFNSQRILALDSYELEGELVYQVPYGVTIPVLIDSAFFAGVVVETTFPDSARRVRRVSVMNSTVPRMIETWMDNHEGKLVDIYGSPLRGYAGGYTMESIN